MTLEQTIDQVLSLAFPQRFAASLLPLKRHLVLQGLTDIQRHIPGFQVGNIDIIPGSFDKSVSGATVLDAPDGEIRRVAIGGEGCQTQFATLIGHRQMQGFQQSFAKAFDCGSPDAPPVYPTSRAYWSRDGGDLLVYPWVPDGWSIGVQWDGIKRSWESTYEIWWADQVIEILRAHAVAYHNPSCPEFERLFRLYLMELSKLRAERFQIENPVEFNPYSTDILFPQRCATIPSSTSSAGEN